MFSPVLYAFAYLYDYDPVWVQAYKDLGYTGWAAHVC